MRHRPTISFGISVRVYQTGSSIDGSGIDKPRPREEDNSSLGERTFTSMFSFPVSRPQTSFPAVSNGVPCSCFSPVFSSPREETWRWESKLRNRSLPLDSFNLDDIFLLRFFFPFSFTLSSTFSAVFRLFILNNSTYLR